MFQFDTNINVLNSKWEDSIAQISDNSIDLGYTDPPYEMNYKSNIAGSSDWNKNNKPVIPILSKMDNDIIGVSNWKLFLDEYYRVLKDNTFLVLHINQPFLMRNGNLFLESKFAYKGCIIWQKNFSVGGDLYGAMKRDWEPIIYLAKGKPKLNNIQVMRDNIFVERNRISEINDWNFSLLKKEKLGHPTQKPVELAKQIIKLMCVPKGVVLDVFAGSGTIALACKQLEYKNISIESNTKFFELINERLKTNES